MPTSTAPAVASSTSPATPNMTGSTVRTPPSAATITHAVAKAVRMTPSERKLRASITKKVPRVAKALAKLSRATGRAEVLMIYLDRAKRRPIGGRASAKAKKNRRATTIAHFFGSNLSEVSAAQDQKKLVIDALERQLAELRKDCVGVKLHVVNEPDQHITSDENAEDEGDSDLEVEDEQQTTTGDSVAAALNFTR